MRKQDILKLFTLSAFSYLFFSCQDDTLTPTNNESKKELPTQTINDAHLYRSVNGLVNTELISPRIEIYNYSDSSKMIFPQGLKVNFLNADKSLKAKLSSCYAESLQNNTYYLKDSVVIINYKDQDTFYCKDLYWIKDSAIVRTDKDVRRHSQNGIDFAKGLRAKDDFDSVKVKNPYGTQKIKED